MIFLIFYISCFQIFTYFKYVGTFSEFEWSSWTNWPSSCSSTCKTGQRCRIRKCQNTKGVSVVTSQCGDTKGSKECHKCVVKGICPIDAKWSEWYPWSICKFISGKGCGEGTRQRVRICNDPKPKYDGMFCIGNSSDFAQCFISCLEDADEGKFLKESINLHFQTLDNNVVVKRHGDPATLDCYTPTYLKASMTSRKLFVLWHFNGMPLRTLRELLLDDMKAIQGKLNKAGAKTSFRLPKGHIQFTGSKLLIDSVTEDDTGVYTCVLNYDYTDMINTFFVLMVSGRREFAKEFSWYTYNSYADGLENVEVFDKGELRWFLNKKPMFTGLLASLDKRLYTIYVNKSMEGYWECYLYADFSKNRNWIVNSFYLKITYPMSLWDKFSDDPVLSKLAYYFLFGILLMATVSITSFLVVKVRTKDWLNLERKEAIIQEETNNNRLLLMIARRRAMCKTMELMKMAGEDDEDEDDDIDDNSETDDK